MWLFNSYKIDSRNQKLLDLKSKVQESQREKVRLLLCTVKDISIKDNDRILGLQPRDKADMLVVNTIEFFLEEFTRK